jgi:hypothetical protein
MLGICSKCSSSIGGIVHAATCEAPLTFHIVPESELERLVRVANEGRVALEKLMQIGGAEYSIIPPYNWTPISYNQFTKGHRYRVKPKHSFEPFHVGTPGGLHNLGSWLVKLEGNILHIGCKQFLAALVLETIRGLRDAGLSLVTSFEGATPSGRRSGIVWSQYMLSWADCDKIVDALEKAGVK